MNMFKPKPQQRGRIVQIATNRKPRIPITKPLTPSLKSSILDTNESEKPRTNTRVKEPIPNDITERVAITKKKTRRKKATKPRATRISRKDSTE